MPGSTHASSQSSTETQITPARVIREDVDPDQTVWFGDGEAYHGDRAWGPACPDQVGRSEEHTLAEAAEEDKRPCLQCEPVDYRRIATDGGEGDGLHDGSGDLEAALNYVMEAVRRADVLGVDEVSMARLQLAECGARLGFYATTEEERDLVLDDAREHLEAAVDVITDVDVTHPAREALQFYVSYGGSQ